MAAEISPRRQGVELPQTAPTEVGLDHTDPGIVEYCEEAVQHDISRGRKFNFLVAAAKGHLKMLPSKQRGEHSLLPNFEASRAKLQQASNLDIDTASILRYCAITHRMEGRIKSDFSEARKIYEKALKDFGPDPKLCFDFVDFLLKEGQDPRKALQVCNEALEKHPTDSSLFYSRAKVHNALGLHGVALRDCIVSLEDEESEYRDDALDLAAVICFRHKNDFALARFYIALISNITLFVDRSLELLETQLAANVFPEEMSRKKLDRTLLIAHKKPEEALRLFEEIDFNRLSINDHFKGLVARARALAGDRARLVEARRALEEADALLSPKTVQDQLLIYSSRACLCAEEGKLDEAEGYYKEGMRFAEVDKPFLLEYLSFLIRREKHLEAVAICSERFLEEDPEIAYLLAPVYVALDDQEAAIEACEVFLRYRCPNEQRLQVLDFEIGLLEDGEEKYFKMIEACKWDFSSKYVKRVEAFPFFFRSPPSVDFMHMVEAVVLHSEKNPEEALKIFEQIDLEQLSDEDRFRALVGCGVAYLTLGNLKDARTHLEKALRPFSLPPWRRLSNNPPSIPSEKVAKAFSHLAQVCIQEEKLEEAEKHFEMAWKTCPADQQIAVQWIQFLASGQKKDKALEICKALKDEAHPLYFEIYIHFHCEDWEQVKKMSKKFLSSYLLPIDGNRDTWRESLRLKVLDFGIEACLKLRGEGDLLQAQAYALQAFLEDRIRFMERFEEHQWLIIEAHIDEFFRAFSKEETQFTNSQMIRCLTQFLATYAKYLQGHDEFHRNLLRLREQKLVEEGRLGEALQDYLKKEAMQGDGKPFANSQMIHHWTQFLEKYEGFIYDYEFYANLLRLRAQKLVEEDRLDEALRDYQELEGIVRNKPEDFPEGMLERVAKEKAALEPNSIGKSRGE